MLQNNTFFNLPLAANQGLSSTSQNRGRSHHRRANLNILGGKQAPYDTSFDHETSDTRLFGGISSLLATKPNLVGHGLRPGSSSICVRFRWAKLSLDESFYPTQVLQLQFTFILLYCSFSPRPISQLGGVPR